MATNNKSAFAIEVPMTLSKQTSGTYVYAEQETGNSKVPSLYIRKSAFKGEPPKSITLVIQGE